MFGTAGSLMKQMEHEHTKSPDSELPFSTSNGVAGASSSEEWEFVISPDPDRCASCSCVATIG